MRMRQQDLWHYPEFVKLWIGATISDLGSQVSFIALALTAAVYLHATPLALGFLAAARAIPPLLIGLAAGAWVDRLPRRPVLIAADLIRAALLVSVPAAAFVGWLRIEHLYIVSVLMGVVEPFPAVAAQAFLRTLVRPEHVLEANSKLSLSFSATLIAGPAVGGVLIQWLTAPGAIIADVVSYLLSALFLASIHAHERIAPRPEWQPRLWDEISEGLLLVQRATLLRVCVGTVAWSVLFDNLAWPAYLLLLTRQLTLSPASLGMIFGAVGPGYLVGTLLARSATRRLGRGKAMAGALFVSGIGSLLVPLIHGRWIMIVALLIAVDFVKAMAASVYLINRSSLTTAITPDDMQGRVASVVLVVSWGAAALGLFSGGLLATWLGARPVLLIGGGGLVLTSAWAACSLLRAT